MGDGTSELKLITGTADVIIKYGFLGVGLVLMVLIAPIVWKRSQTIGLASLSSGLAFLVTFGALNVVERYFPQLIISKNKVLFGVVLSVPDGFAVAVSDDEWHVGQAYLKRENHPDDRSMFNQYFLLASVGAPHCLGIIIQPTRSDPQKPDSRRQFIFNVDGLDARDIPEQNDLVFRASHPDGHSISLTGWREHDNQKLQEPLVVQARQETDPLCGDDAAPPARLPAAPGTTSFLGIAAAFAQESTAAAGSDLAAALRSDDAFVRRHARIDLSHQGAQAAPVLGKLLSSDNYRLQVGALAAIAQMSPTTQARLPVALQAKVRPYVNSSDQTTRELGVKALQGLTQDKQPE